MSPGAGALSLPVVMMEVWLARGFSERGDDLVLAIRKRTRLSAGELTELDGTVAHTNESLHEEAERLAEAADFMISAFGDRDRELPVSATDRLRFDVLGDDESVVQLHAEARAANRRGRVASHRRDIGALDLTARMRQRVRPDTIRREEQHAFGEIIEAANVRETRNVREQIEHRFAPLRIGACGEHAGRLVKDEPLLDARRLHDGAIHRDFVAIRVDDLPELRRRAVHRHPTRGDEILGFATRRDTRAREGALNAHGAVRAHDAVLTARAAVRAMRPRARQRAAARRDAAARTARETRASCRTTTAVPTPRRVPPHQ